MLVQKKRNLSHPLLRHGRESVNAKGLVPTGLVPTGLLVISGNLVSCMLYLSCVGETIE